MTAVAVACENLVSAQAYRPGDIIGSMAGKTIQINSTDAEGRLILIGAMTYAIPLVPDARPKLRGDVSDLVNTTLEQTGGW